ncbi:MAG: hypothetical protein SF162_07370 [bacterium]|nr:hypothetical protein [bacterium]
MTHDAKIGGSQAAMRLVAQTTFYNRGEPERLIQFIADAYAPDLLDQQPPIQKAAAFAQMRQVVGRVKVQKWLALDKHEVIARMESETGVRFVVELKCADEYPHKITAYMQHPASG